MGIEKQGSKGGNYVGGFLQMFDWNAKSRKKLFSSKSDIPEQSKQKKRCDGNLPMTRIPMMDEDEIEGGSSIKGSSDYSCASSVTDEDFYRTKAPGVVARLMGLDSLPKANIEPYSTPLFDTQSLRDSYYRTKNLEYHQDETMHTEPKYQKVIHRPIEKFQTETLPPKSAKSIPITHHKLLSPIKSVNFIPRKEAAHIMEAAARIIEPGPRGSTKTKTALAGSSSVPLRVRDLREKVQAAQKPLKIFEGSQRKAESNAVKNLKGHSMNKSWNGSTDSEESSVGVRSKGKSISLALQAKANVQKREGLNSSKSVVSQKEPCEFSPNHVFKSQSSTQKSMLKKPSSQNALSVLRQNNQKQNCIVDRGKLPLKSNSQGGKALSGDSSSGRQRNNSKVSVTSKVGSRKLGSDVKDDKREASLCSSSERVTRKKKRSIDGNYHSEKSHKNGEVVKCGGVMDRQSSWEQESGSNGNDVISFTFTAPMTRSGFRENSNKVFSGGSQSKRTMVSSDGTSFSKFSFPGHNLRGGDALSTLLEQKLKELSHTVELSQQKSETALMSSTMTEGIQNKDAMEIDNQVGPEEISMSDNTTYRAGKLLDCRHPSPVSVLEHSSFMGSCNSSDSNSTKDSKQCSSIQAQEVLDTTYSSKIFLPTEGDIELSDSASSTSAKNLAKRRETTLTSTYYCKKPRKWELEYFNKILCNIATTFNDYSSGRACDMINPHLFDQLESWKGDCGPVPRISRRLMFDCVSECLELRFKQYVGGGFKLWAKGLSVATRKERLVEEVYKEISGWSEMGDYMVDELVDKDMSSQYGRWLDFETEVFELGIQIESRILNTLIDEVVADILVL
ncbi:hypothetical protein BUALT_Bualt12G0115900 [Buddleja alternifolia]|uniref:DUF4378 domain-containing protein n=1 Tax=Buddleja alternifolia TaxID=168488 RepID=A0AAV6WXA1_9LAMI|nr:hypothetical protein BUALT_Bualt12G0115900 [Buddleja alternifolia]